MPLLRLLCCDHLFSERKKSTGPYQSTVIRVSNSKSHSQARESVCATGVALSDFVAPHLQLGRRHDLFVSVSPTATATPSLCSPYIQLE